MNGQSLSPHIEKLNQLRQIFPEVFSEGKIDWEKLRITLGENINFANERYVLNWAGKSDAFRVMQQPSTRTLVPVREDSVDFDDTQNIFIEGENLEVLKVLQKSYFGKVKMIYIDPPYNTGNDSFIYPDKFSETKEEYQKRVGDKDEDGYMTGEGMFRKNSRENGQYHSNWLNMMMPRLYLARTLLRDDGVIFISIDDNEVHNLRLLMNEIFGEENFVANIVWQHSIQPKGYSNIFSNHHNHILCFSKTSEYVVNSLLRTDEDNKAYSNPDNDPKGPWRSGDVRNALYRPNLIYDIISPSGNIIKPCSNGWRWSKETIEKKIQTGEIIFNVDETKIIRKIYLSNLEGRAPESIWFAKDVGSTRDAMAELKNLFENPPFDTPKPTKLIEKMIQLVKDKNGIILDFFSGSATTAHAVMQLNKEDGGNRKYILVQMPELCDEKSEAFKAGYKTIAEIAKERIRRAGKKIREEIKREVEKKKGELNFAADDNQAETQVDTGFKVFRLSESNFKQWQQPENYTAEALAEQLKLFIDPVAENADLQNMVYELLLKSGKDLNVKIEANDGYYLIDGNDLALILEKVDEQIITEVLCEYPKKVIALDRIFKGKDQLKTNTALQMKDAGVEFKTI
ncbi:site-specific DNA-methyltransferase [Proteiniphilum sp. X52]|nr:site-specific DNA-methyltransferase [Proteiniphilum sp. X52]